LDGRSIIFHRTVISANDLAGNAPGALTMDIKRAGSQPSTKGPTDWFTGTVRSDDQYQAQRSAR